MSKLIYVDRLKKDILALQDCYNGFSDTYDKACIIGVIEEQPTVEERKWIPCSERLPEEEEDVLVTDGESMAVGYYREDVRAWDSVNFGWIENRENGYGINEVIAWMPLPEPYKGGNDES